MSVNVYYFLAFLTTSTSNSTIIHFPTHDDGHTLDLLITRTSSDITHLSHHESYQSDNNFFTFKFFSHIRPTTQRSVMQYRSFKSIDIHNFISNILSSLLYTNPASNSSDLSYIIDFLLFERGCSVCEAVENIYI